MGGGTCIYTEGRSYWGLSLETTSHILDGNMPDINQVFRLIKERGGMTMGDIQQPSSEGKVWTPGQTPGHPGSPASTAKSGMSRNDNWSRW